MTAALPPLLEPRAEWFAHPHRTMLQVAAAGVSGDEAGVDDDAIGIVAVRVLVRPKPADDVAGQTS